MEGTAWAVVSSTVAFVLMTPLAEDTVWFSNWDSSAVLVRVARLGPPEASARGLVTWTYTQAGGGGVRSGWVVGWDR